jgi:hypothetical protein
LKGTILTELGKMADLYHLDLAYNELSGTIPVELASLQQLTYLDLGEGERARGVCVCVRCLEGCDICVVDAAPRSHSSCGMFSCSYYTYISSTPILYRRKLTLGYHPNGDWEIDQFELLGSGVLQPHQLWRDDTQGTWTTFTVDQVGRL